MDSGSYKPMKAVIGRVGVVVLTHNRKEALLRTLHKLVALDERPRICVVDNASNDGSSEAVARLAQIEARIGLVRLEINLGGAGRNEGVRRMQEPYVAFCDDDTWWAPGALTRAADLLDTLPALAAITGRVRVEPDEPDDPIGARMGPSALPNPLGFPARAVGGFRAEACVMRRSAFLAAGGFDPRFFVGGEESLLAMDLLAAGWLLAYVPEIELHRHSSRRGQTTHRRALQLRNALWCAWLRRPLGSALRETLRRLAQLRDDPILVTGVLSALSGLPWVLRRRKVVPSHVEAALRTLVLELEDWPPRRRQDGIPHA